MENCIELLNKIDILVKKAPSDLTDELYPRKLGQAVLAQIPEERLAVIAKYEGIALTLKELGGDTKYLESIIEIEADKTLKM
jgi:hypothetical protein